MRLFFISLLLLVTGSCTVTKRIHRPGMSIQWYKGYTSEKSVEPSRNKAIEINAPADISESFAVEHSQETEKKERLSSNEPSQTTYAIVLQEENTTPRIDFQPIQLLKKTIKQAEQLKHKRKSIKTKSTGNNTEEKPRSFYMGMGILSIILILALGITLLATLGSPVLYYTAGIALLGIPLLFIYAIKNFRSAQSIPKIQKIRVTPTITPNQQGNKPDALSSKGSQDKISTVNTAAITSFVLFITSILLILVPFLSLLLFIASVIAGIIAISRNNRSPFRLRYTGLAWASVGITITFTVILLIALILFL